jgi:carbamoyltransferase
MIILGLNSFHADSSAALIRDGQLVAAAEEERFSRTKHWAGFPRNAIDYCLQEAGIGVQAIDHIAINQNNKSNLAAKLAYALSGRAGIGLITERLSQRKARAGVPDLLAQAYATDIRGQFHNVDHHLAHLASAFYVSQFQNAAVVSIDGFGDFASAAWGLGRNTDLSITKTIFFPHSLGVFFQALTQYLGFPHYGDEYKVMGLAPYGTPRFMPQMRKIVLLESSGTFSLDLRYFKHHRERISYQWDNGAPAFGELFTPELTDLLGPPRKPTDSLDQRHQDIANSVQAMYEEAFFHVLGAVRALGDDENIALAGGCALNSVANGRIRRKTAFRNVYVQAAAGDAGGSIGAALTVWHRLGGKRSFFMDHAYWGPQFGASETDEIIASRASELKSCGCRIERLGDEVELCRRTAEFIAEGKVIGWFQGRMEWGPRALGNRSILADPRRPDMKELLNAKIKRRESFRPFAPSILEEAVSDWFEENDAVPFMMKVYQFRDAKRALVPAVVHVDGSGRLQTVSKSTNPRYHSLITSFSHMTGVPILLNTSFNENEPIVCRPQEALDCFLRTNMDVLVIGDVMLSRDP